MSSILQTIIERNRPALEERRRLVPASELERRAAECPPRPSLAASLRRPGIRVIAELKSASPSSGVIRADFRPAELAVELEKDGAAALSVLTEPYYFHGSPEILKAVSMQVSLPLLRKDFIVDPYQILEAKCLGASAVLLIAAALDDGRLRRLAEFAASLGLEVLGEAHSAEEIDRLLAVPATMIGVNARNLADFSTSLALSESLIGRIPPERIPVAESAIHSAADVRRLYAAGARGFLIGEALMRAAHPGEALRALIR